MIDLNKFKYKSFTNIAIVYLFILFSLSYNCDFTNVIERWCNHVSGWINSDYALIIKYKDLINNYEDSIMNIANYLNLNLRSKLEKVDIRKSRSHFPNKGLVGAGGFAEKW